MDQSAPEITRILLEWNKGDPAAKERLLGLVYGELRRQARILMSRERSDHTLQPTALVHEAFLRLEKQAGVDWKDRNHFYGIASRLMREILIDHARRHASAKRGQNPITFSLDHLNVPIEERAYSLIALNDALDQLDEVAPRQARIVEMRFFGGMDIESIAQALETSERTVSREWTAARLWLFNELNAER